MDPALPWEGEHGLDPAALPLAVVRRDPAAAADLPQALQDVAGLPVTGADGRSTTLSDVLAESATDAWLMLHEGTVVSQWYRPGVAPTDRRVLMSISKSVIGALTGALAGMGMLRPEDLLTKYVPELAGSGYEGATLRDVLDMRSGVRFREDYVDPTSDLRAMDAAIAAGPGMKAYLLGLTADRPHGGLFNYRSCETDVLGWVCERAAAAPVPDLVSRLLWQPMGAQHDAAFMCDRFGAAISDGGMLATAGDVARFGLLLLGGGVVGDRELVPRSWLSDIWTVTPQLRSAFAESAAGPFLPGGWYRSQCWVLPGPHGDVLLALGIHGQLLRVDPATRTVIVKLSSWPYPQDPMRLHDTLRACEAAAGAVSGRPARSGPRFGPGTGRLPPVAGR